MPTTPSFARLLFVSAMVLALPSALRGAWAHLPGVQPAGGYGDCAFPPFENNGSPGAFDGVAVCDNRHARGASRSTADACRGRPARWTMLSQTLGLSMA